MRHFLITLIVVFFIFTAAPMRAEVDGDCVNGGWLVTLIEPFLAEIWQILADFVPEVDKACQEGCGRQEWTGDGGEESGAFAMPGWPEPNGQRNK